MIELKRKAAETPRLKDGAHTPFAEAYRALRTNLEYQADTQGVKSFLLAVPDEKSDQTVFAENLARTMAVGDKKILLVDGDIPDKKLTLHMGLRPEEKGFTDVLQSRCRLADAVKKCGAVSVLPTGTSVDDPAGLFAAGAEALLRQLEETYDTVLVTAPPVCRATDAAVLSRAVKGTIVLVEAGTVPQDCVQKCRDALLAVGANLLGAVLTDYDPKKI